MKSNTNRFCLILFLFYFMGVLWGCYATSRGSWSTCKPLLGAAHELETQRPVTYPATVESLSSTSLPWRHRAGPGRSCRRAEPGSAGRGAVPGAARPLGGSVSPSSSGPSGWSRLSCWVLTLSWEALSQSPGSGVSALHRAGAGCYVSYIRISIYKLYLKKVYNQFQHLKSYSPILSYTNYINTANIYIL